MYQNTQCILEKYGLKTKVIWFICYCTIFGMSTCDLLGTLMAHCRNHIRITLTSAVLEQTPKQSPQKAKIYQVLTVFKYYLFSTPNQVSPKQYLMS